MVRLRSRSGIAPIKNLGSCGERFLLILRDKLIDSLLSVL